MSQGERAAARATSSSAVVPIVDCTCAPRRPACWLQGLRPLAEAEDSVGVVEFGSDRGMNPAEMQPVVPHEVSHTWPRCHNIASLETRGLPRF